MKKFKRLIASFVVVMTFLAVTPMAAHAEWKSDSTGWWYTEGNSWATGWRQIDGSWYYFYPDGYMAHDTTIDGCYLNSSGAWVSNQTTNTNTGTNINGTVTAATNNYVSTNQYVDSNGKGLIKGSKNNIYHVPGGKYYDKTTNVAQWFKTVEEAEAAGYRAPEK